MVNNTYTQIIDHSEYFSCNLVIFENCVFKLNDCFYLLPLLKKTIDVASDLK